MAKLEQKNAQFHKLVNQKTGKRTQTDRLKKEKAKCQARLSELSNLLLKLFEKNNAGLLDHGNYAAFSRKYQAEQVELAEKLTAIKAKLAKADETTVNVEKLRENVSTHLDVKELTPFILAKLIDRILVGHKQEVDGQRAQEITIVWRFAGEV